ncbi:hypothetical protein G6F42_014325 [Rhizopus arrhizus]|nr:hypothetical protein G6F42_014325 [Rhizopus arrhizus]
MTLWSILATCIACLGGFLFGYDLGVVGGMLIAPSFQTYFHIDPNNKIQEAEINGNIVSVLQVGCLFGSLLATSTADALGRKYSIMTAACVFTIGGVFQIIGYNLMILYLGRVISGLGVGALSMLVPIYVAEIAHQRHRGLLGGLWMFFIATGLASSYWSNYIVIPSVMLLFGMAFLFETPRWLCAHHRSEEALQVLCKIRGTEDVKEEMEQIQSSLSAQAKDTSWRQTVSITNKKRLLLGSPLYSNQ